MTSALASVGFGRATPDAMGLDGSILEDHRKRVHMHRKNGAHPGMAECIVVDGKVVYADLCGLADKEHRIPMSERTLFRGYSMMKSMTAAAFMTLVDDGSVSIDAPVTKYLPKFANLKVLKKNGSGVEPLKRQMTLRHLLMHTSGLGYGPGVIDVGQVLVARTPMEKAYKDMTLKQDSGEIDSLAKLCDALSEKPLFFQPGAGYEYSLGIDVIGHIIELVTGKPLRQIIQNRILTPTGMRDTTWDVPRSRARQLCGYYRLMRTPGTAGRWLERLDGKHPEDSAYVRGSATFFGRNGCPTGGGFWGSFRTGLLFSMRDVASFCQMLLQDGVSVSGRRVLKAATVQSLLRNWLVLKSVADKPMPPGWTSENVGWSPLGHVQLDGPHKGAMYMGGVSYWWMDVRRKMFAAIMTETYWQAQPLGCNEELDNMEKVLARSVAASDANKRKRVKDDGAARKNVKRAKKG